MKNDRYKWDASHRPWQLPKFPWVMRQSWNNLLFLHFPVSIDKLRKLVPRQLTIDTYEDTAWISIVPFNMENVGLRAIPFSIQFPELNIRTYITIDNKPGVYFFSLDASNFPVVWLLNTFLKLPYIHSNMDIKVTDENTSFKNQRKKDSSIQFNCSYKPTSEPFFAEPNTLEHWLTERYCFYKRTMFGKVKRCDILHQPWLIQHAEVNVTSNTLPIMSQLNIEHVSPLVHYSKGVDVRIWPFVKV